MKNNFFLIMLFVLILTPGVVFSYTNRLTVVPGASFYLSDEPADRAGILAYGFDVNMEYDISNSLNFLIQFTGELPYIFGGSTEFANEFYFITGAAILKYYPTVTVKTSYFDSKQESILVENRLASITPYVGAGALYCIAINDTGTADYDNLSTVGAIFMVGFDLPFTHRWGLTFYNQINLKATPQPPILILLQYHMGFGPYFIF